MHHKHFMPAGLLAILLLAGCAKNAPSNLPTASASPPPSTAQVGGELPPVTDGLVLFLPLDEKLTDVRGLVNEKDIFNRGGVPAENRKGEKAKALRFDGDDYLEVHAPDLVQTWPLTWAFWMKVDSWPTGLAAPAGKFVHPSGDGLFFMWEDNEFIGAYSTHKYERYCRYDGSFPEDGEWHHVALTQDGTSLKLYIDGELNGEHPWRGEPDQATTNEPIRLGKLSSYHETEQPAGLKGVMDSFAVYDRALSQDEVRSLAGER